MSKIKSRRSKSHEDDTSYTAHKTTLQHQVQSRSVSQDLSQLYTLEATAERQVCVLPSGPKDCSSKIQNASLWNIWCHPPLCIWEVWVDSELGHSNNTVTGIHRLSLYRSFSIRDLWFSFGMMGIMSRQPLLIINIMCKSTLPIIKLD